MTLEHDYPPPRGCGHCGALSGVNQHGACNACGNGSDERAFSIARALASFDGGEEAQICAFLEEMEKGRLEGIVAGWRMTRDPDGCKLEVMFTDGTQERAVAETFKKAGKSLGRQMIARAMQGAPEA